MTLKHATSRKLRNRGLQPIRYHDGTGYRHGWVVREGARGALTIHLIGDERNRRLSVKESQHVQRYDNRMATQDKRHG